jgi:hypothetical protein
MRPGTVATLLAALAVVSGACGSDDGGAIDLSGPAEVATGAPQLSPDGDAGGDGDDDGVADGVRGSVGGQGSSTVTVAGVTFVADDAFCVADPSGLSFGGVAAGSDGSSAWVSFDYGVSTRDEMAGVFDDETLDLLFDEGSDVLEELTIDIRVGETSPLEPTDGQPWWSATTAGASGNEGADELLVEFTGTSLRGSGTARDLNGAPDGPTDDDPTRFAPIEFDVRCT